MSLVIGIDGGATRSRALVMDAEGAEVARAEGGPALVKADAPTAAASGLADLAARALAAARMDEPGAMRTPSGLDPQTTDGEAADLGHAAEANAHAAVPPDGRAAALCCALAGAGRQPERDAIQAALQARGLAHRIIVTTDAEAALEDAFAGGPGIIVIAGTGSIAWGRSADGRTTRAGGWGQRFGDEGSGYAIGIAALRATAQTHDGRGAATALVRPVLRHTGVVEPEALIAWAAAASKADIAALAPTVLAAAEEGDEVAGHLATRAGAELAMHVVALARRLGPWLDTLPLALAGGLLAPGRPLRRHVQNALDDLRCEAEPLDRIIDAARGAATLARGAATIPSAAPGTPRARSDG